MTGVVIDTNVWLDWLVFDDPCIHELRDAVTRGELQPLACAVMRSELFDVLGRPLILARGTDPGQAIERFDGLVHFHEAPPSAGLVCRDPDDQVFIDLAVAARARWLISKDKALLALAASARRRFDLLICTPAGWKPA